MNYAAIALLLLDSTFSGRYSLLRLPFAAIGAKVLAGRLRQVLPAVTVGLVAWSAILLVPCLPTVHGQRAPAEVAAERIRQLARGVPIALIHTEELRV